MPKVFISSTKTDLIEHRQQAINACLQLHYHPEGMENWSAADATALDFCLKKVDESDIFIGIYGHRYGWTPPGERKSITELEYDRAVEKGIPRLLFLMGDDHPVLPKDFDTGDEATALQGFKARIQTERARATFNNPDQLRAEILHALASLNGHDDGKPDAPRINLSHLPNPAPNFLGRDSELQDLDSAWDSEGKTAIVELIAPGGTGKTSLLNDWLSKLRDDNWRGAQQVYGWSFYSQGSSDDRNASEDLFLAEALQWFGVQVEARLNPADKGYQLAEKLRQSRNLLVLDGLEPLQYPPSSNAAGLAGELRAPGLQALLTHLARTGHPGLVLVSSREALTDLNGWANKDQGTVCRIDLNNLSSADGARLLHASGADHAGQVVIKADDPELIDPSADFNHHALSLTLLGSYLKRAYRGDVRRWREVDLAKASEKTEKDHAFRVMAAYEKWLRTDAPTELAALRLLGFFDRPATPDNIAALRAAPVIPGLTEALQDLDEADWNTVLSDLATCRLLSHDPANGRLDAHPLLREYFAKALETQQPEAWREGNRRLYVQLKESAPYRPEGLEGLQPLYQAVVHGCRAGLYQETLDEVYCDRILRGTGNDGFYTQNMLGAFGADLGAVACFFDQPWQKLAPQLSEPIQAWLLGQSALCLQAVGRLSDALKPMRAGIEMEVKQKSWRNASISYFNLCNLRLSLGMISASIQDAEQSVACAYQSGNSEVVIISLCDLANILYQLGEDKTALQGFLQAEKIQSEQFPNCPKLQSRWGFLYSELLLTTAEKAGWRKNATPTGLKACTSVSKRARQNLVWATANGNLLSIALDHLTLTRCALYTDLLQGRPPSPKAQTHCEAAVSCLRQAGIQDYLPLGLLTRVWLHHALGERDAALADLDEAHRIASRGGMKLHLADIALYRARFFQDQEALAEARKLIQECEYWRRKDALEFTETLLASTSTESA